MRSRSRHLSLSLCACIPLHTRQDLPTLHQLSLLHSFDADVLVPFQCIYIFEENRSRTRLAGTIEVLAVPQALLMDHDLGPAA